MKRSSKHLLQLLVVTLIVVASLFGVSSCKKRDKTKYYTITFESNGGTPVSSRSVKENDPIGSLPSSTKDGYDFIGWFLNNDQSNAVDENYIVKSDLKLYAGYQRYFNITFETNDGTSVSPKRVKSGEVLGNLPLAAKQGYNFLGWYKDAEYEDQAYTDDVVTSDLVLYALYEKTEIDTVLPEFSEISIDTDDIYYAFYLTSTVELDEKNITDFVKVSALYGTTPRIEIEKTAEYYVLRVVGGYQTGGVYTINIVDESVKFTKIEIETDDEKLQLEQIKTINLSVLGDEFENVQYNSDIIEINYADISLNETEFVISEELYKLIPLTENKIVHVVSSNTEEDFYVKVVDVVRSTDEYVVTYSECDVDDVYGNLDINLNETTAVNDYTLAENKDATDAALMQMVQSLYSSEGTEAITTMLASALNASPTIKDVLKGKKASSNNHVYRDRITDKTGMTISVEGLLENLTIKAVLGSAKNPNFNGIAIPKYNDDRWTMLQLTFEYEGTLKNKVKLEASITITEYLYVWFNINTNSKTGDFKVEATPLSQTDIEFKVLICSADESDDDDENKEEKKDISVEISNLVDGTDTDVNIIEEVQEMLENKGDAIELCKAPLFQTSYVIGGVVSLNFDLNFVIKVSFAAGVKIEATVLEAVTIGVTGNYRDKTIDTYRKSAKGSDRYIFDFYAYGYLGVKAGIEGEFTISFVGLKKALRAGVSVEVGAYADLYGYLHFHAEETRVYKDVDTNGRHYQTLEGGIYFEMGIYLELRAFIGVGKKEFGIGKEFKFKLLEAGDKYLYVEPAENENLKLIFNENEDNALSLEGIIPAEGKFLNIVTGEVETRVLPTKNIKVISLSNLYKIDNKKHEVHLNLDKLEKRTETIPSGKIALYYKGPNILFSSKQLADDISEFKGFKQLAEIEVYYVRKGIEIDEEKIGKEVQITYQIDVDNEVKVLKTLNLIAGQYIESGVPYEIYYYCIENNLLWDLSVSEPGCSYDGPMNGKVMVSDNQVFTFKTHKAERFIAVQYISNHAEKLWTLEIYAMYYDELPQLLEKHLNVPERVGVYYNVVEPNGNTHPMGTSEFLSRYEPYRRGTYGYETGIVLDSFTGTAEAVTTMYNNMLQNEGQFAAYNDYFTYTLKGEYQNEVLKVIYYDIYGNYQSDNVVMGETFKVPSYWVANINNKEGVKLAGFDTNDDGVVDILPNQAFVVNNNMVLKPVLAAEGYTLTIKNIDGSTNVYYLNYGDSFSPEILEKINGDPTVKTSLSEGSSYAEGYYLLTASAFVGTTEAAYFAGISNMYKKDLTSMPACDLLFEAVNGKVYHQVKLKDETGGYYFKNDDPLVHYKEIVLMIEDGRTVGHSKEFAEYTYVAPESGSQIKYVSYYLADENDDILNYYSTEITSAKEYHVVWWKVEVDSNSIEFVVKEYDKYGNIIKEVVLHQHNNLPKEQYNELIKKYDEEYAYLTSDKYYDLLSENSNYIYSKYQYGDLNVNSESNLDYYGRIMHTYIVCIRKVMRTYTITVDWNQTSSKDNSHYTLDINSIYTCEPSSYYYVETIVDEYGYTRSIFHYFKGFDVDGDGVADYAPGEEFVVTKDLTLVALYYNDGEYHG